MSSSSSSQPTGENVPPEIAHVLKQPEGSKDAKQELYQQQKMLNLKRKVGQKIERLQNALTRKSLQMQAFQDHIKATLKKELEKFAAEKKSIQEQLVVAQEQLAKLEAGEKEIEETMEPFVDTPEELAGLLGLPTPLPINYKAIYMGYTSINIY